ncbi:WecB/TagA/CpsF family glycosyltransferase [Clostridium sp. 'deep sea']|uniref:WecB/TagA/CpsF family glycosyltransferase n=1 Tax=Clostridium sp. 'deep sea' TaxID=2779445 RepID=UPI0018967502|nr:WecB/TagA/CpsF family glycosyltransferase [Clostridium sp. 'deep sea']QOR33682.1 WecB/TagA/CpsF family glycosyltransferase [Clostridium sp. 'deep sea']
MIKDVCIISDIPIYKSTLKNTAQLINSWINEGKMRQHIVTANSEVLYKTKSDLKLKRILQKASLVTADGIGVVWASKILGDSLPERVTGYDLMHELFSLMNNTEKSVYLLGAKPEVVSAATFEIKRLYPGVVIKGYSDGYFDKELEVEIINDIKALEPDLLLVCLGCPTQEYWINENLAKLPVKVAIGLGGSFDHLAGVLKRAPERWQKMGMEWAYRLVTDPKRIGRATALPKFGLSIIKDKFFGNH